MKMHKSITEYRILALIKEDDNLGLCVYCGMEADSVEPDGRGYDCSNCGKNGVYGCEELLFYIVP